MTRQINDYKKTKVHSCHSASEDKSGIHYNLQTAMELITKNENNLNLSLRASLIVRPQLLNVDHEW